MAWGSNYNGPLRPGDIAYGQSNLQNGMNSQNNFMPSMAPLVAPPAAAPVSPMSMIPSVGQFQASPEMMNIASYGAASTAGLTTPQGSPIVNPAAEASDPTGNWFTNTFGNGQGGLNIGNITGMLGSVGGIVGAIKQYGLMKDSLNFQKEAFRTNLDNQTKSYNTALTDRAGSRAAAYGKGQDYVDDYVNKNRL